jgi:hypothetical protein
MVLNEGISEEIADLNQQMIGFQNLLLSERSIIRSIDTSTLCQCPNPLGYVVGAGAASQFVDAVGVVSKANTTYADGKPGGAHAAINTANALKAAWIKYGGENRMGVVFASDGTAYTNAPELTLEIPSGVPSGYLRFDIDKYHLTSLRVNNSGAGTGFEPADATGEDYFGIKDSAATVVINVDGTDIVTIAPETGHVSEFVQLKISKDFNTAKPVVVRVTATANGADMAFCIDIKYRYSPIGVTLYDLMEQKVSPASTDPIIMHIEQLQYFSQYLDSQGLPQIHEILTQRLGSTVSAELVHPDSWQGASFPVTHGTWIKTYVSVMNDLTRLALTQPAFLTNDF